MKKILVVLALVMPMLVSAQKYGHVNSTELFQQMPEVAKVKAKLDTIQSQYETQYTMMVEEFQKKYKDYQANQATMPDAIKAVQEQDLQDMQARIQTYAQTVETDLQKQQQELLAPVHEKLIKAIKAVGEREGYTYIFDSAALVYIADNAVDASPAVRKELGIK